MSHLLVDLLKPVQKTMESNGCNSPFLNRTSLPLTLSISAPKTYISQNIKKAASSRHRKQTLWCKIAAKDESTTCDAIQGNETVHLTIKCIRMYLIWIEEQRKKKNKCLQKNNTKNLPFSADYWIIGLIEHFSKIY